MPVLIVLLLAWCSLLEASPGGRHAQGGRNHDPFRNEGRRPNPVNKMMKTNRVVHTSPSSKPQVVVDRSHGQKTGAVDPKGAYKAQGSMAQGDNAMDDDMMEEEMMSSLKSAMNGIMYDNKTNMLNKYKGGQASMAKTFADESRSVHIIPDPAMPSNPGIETDWSDGTASLPWYKILEYSSSTGYTPTASASGKISAGDAASTFAKLSDDTIYRLGGKKYSLRFKSTLDNTNLYLNIDGINYTDTANGMGYNGKTVGVCEASNMLSCTYSNVALGSAFRSLPSYDNSKCSLWVGDQAGGSLCNYPSSSKRCFQTGVMLGGGTCSNEQVRSQVTVWIKPQEFDTHADCEDFSGYYMDDKGFTTLLQQFGCLVMARNYARWPSPDAVAMETLSWTNNTAGIVKGESVELFGLSGWTLDLANNPNRSQALFGMSKLIFEPANGNANVNKKWYREPCNRFHGLYSQGDTQWLVNQSACVVNITKVTDPKWPSEGQPYTLGTVEGNTITYSSPATTTGTLDASLLIVSWLDSSLANAGQWVRGADWL